MMAALATATMNAASLRVGFCNGQIATTGQSGMGKTTISAAAEFPAEMLEPYRGAKIEAVRIGLVTAEGVTELSGWVRADRDGANLDCTSVLQPTAGWNEATLAGGLLVDDQPLIVGYSFKQDKSVKCISGVGDEHTNGLMIGRIDNAGNLSWRTVEGQGSLSVELVLSRDDFASLDLGIVSVSQDPLPVRYGQDVTLSFKVENQALEPVNEINFSYQFEGQNAVSQTYSSVLNAGESTVVPVTIEKGNYPLGVTPLTFTLHTEGDEKAENDTLRVLFGSYDSAPRHRRVLLEEFTSEFCPNCLRGINTVAQAVAEFGDSLSVVAHHSGFSEDFLTTDEDLELEWFYNPQLNSTYAPAFMLDRSPQHGETKGCVSQFDAVTASLGTYDTFREVVQRAYQAPTFADVECSSSYDPDTRLLSIDVEAEKDDMLDVLCPEPYISVYIIEDGIPHHMQVGVTGEFNHSHVYRAAPTGVWGQKAEFVDGQYKGHFDYTVPMNWVPDNLCMVAFLHGMDRAARTTGCRVFNSAVSSLLTLGVEDVNCTPTSGEAAYYDLTGRRVSAPRHGIYVKVQNGKNLKINN